MPSTASRRKTRSIPFNLGTSLKTIHYWTPGGGGSPPTDVFDERSLGTVYGSQVTDSVGHQFRRLNAAAGDVGGPFFTQKKYFSGNPGRLVKSFSGETNRPYWSDQFLDSPVWPLAAQGLSFPPSTYSGNSALNQAGATAVARAKPTNQLANLATFLGELRQGFPKFGHTSWEAKTDAARAAGSDYLNTQFGWMPLTRDLTNFAVMAVQAGQIMAQFERDAGKVVRRRFDFPQTSSVNTTFYTNAVPFYQGSIVGLNVDVTDLAVWRKRETSSRQWFSGAFTYYLPKGFTADTGILGHMQRAEKLFGLRLTPDVVWNLSPWSWAVDWFSNVGDVISNVTAWTDDSLVMRYGYLMEHTMVKDTYYRETPTPFTDKRVHVGNPQLVVTTETKQRIRANPFGFGVSWDSLSPFQLSIAAGLGLSRT